MKQFIVLALVIPAALAACNNKQQSPETGVTTTPETTATPAADPAKDSAEIRKTITDFYNWYNKNDSRFFDYHLYSGTKKKDAPPYKINWEEVEKYQSFIRANVPQLGEEFISHQKKFLQQCDSAFKVDVTDDIPYGFDYDWYTNSQDDAQYLVDEINKPGPWAITWLGDYATIPIKGSYDDGTSKVETTLVVLTMKKENGQWKIARIGGE